MSKKKIYKVAFYNQGKIYEVFAKKVYQADLYGFVAIEELTFSERSSVVVDPSEEKLKTEFQHVSRCFIPMHAVVRIDEVEKPGVAKITDMGDKIAHFPVPQYGPTNDKGKT